MPGPFSTDLLLWFEKEGRNLPWREVDDPYAIWVAEVMLQQTRVETVIPYYVRWLDKFPTLEQLASAETDDVLRLWEGLGYYRRAHNLHRAARIICEKYRGMMPQEPAELKALPGIGRYTAAAIASIAFGKRVVAIDGNLRRVISRIINYDLDATTASAERQFQTWASRHIPESYASAFNQALMDLGATICISKNPTCSKCPISSYCESFVLGIQNQRPVKRRKPEIPHYVVSAGILRRDGKVLIGRRPVGKLLGGLWEFPGGKCLQDESLDDCLVREWQEELNMLIEPGGMVGVFHHAYTHFKVTVHAIECSAADDVPNANVHSEIRWVDPDCLGEFPMGKVDRAIASLISQNGPLHRKS